MRDLWQQCPVCNGAKMVSGGYFSRAGDYNHWVSGNAFETCQICDGKGIIRTPPPEKENS